jgi:dienelactone hydrolase
LNEQHVSKETFDVFLKQYEYDKTELDAVVEWVREEEEWIREKITFNAAYGNERVIAYLFLPKQGAPPYQTVVYFPGVAALYMRTSEDQAIPLNYTWGPGTRDFLQKSGRAVLYPIYKSTFERSDDFNADSPSNTHLYKEHVIMWVKDMIRSIDYLETRDDIDVDKIAYFGYSWGSTLGPIMAAVEKRIKTSVLLVGGIDFLRYLPEADVLHYLPRVTTPVLMLNGRYDFFYPYETSQLPFFELIGTPKENKKLFLAETSHIVPKTDVIRETLAWLDRYLGPVE